MRNLLLAAVVGIMVTASVPAWANGVFDNAEDVGHFIAGMLVQEWREDVRNEERRQEEAAAKAEQAARMERGRGHGQGNMHKPADREWTDHERGMNKMQKLFRVHDRIVDDVLEESYEATEFVLDIHENNGHHLQRTAEDMRPFVFDYFEVFNQDQCEMYELWVETKFESWLERYSRMDR